MRIRIYLLFLVLGTVSLGCNKKKISLLEQEVKSKNEQIDQLNEELTYLRGTNANLLDRMTDLSVISKTGAENLGKSLESISQQYAFIEGLSDKIQLKDSLNLALVMNLKRSLDDINDEDVQIEVKEGVVYVSISDKLLFQSGSSKINSLARSVLGKLALVLNDHAEMNILVEGHTDNVPINNNCTIDNWDLSTKRATAVVRYLQTRHQVDPTRMTAAGCGEYKPKTDNLTGVSRSVNRRTEIILTPKLDQFFQLLEAPPLSD